MPSKRRLLEGRVLPRFDAPRPERLEIALHFYADRFRLSDISAATGLSVGRITNAALAEGIAGRGKTRLQANWKDMPSTYPPLLLIVAAARGGATVPDLCEAYRINPVSATLVLQLAGTGKPKREPQHASRSELPVARWRCQDCQRVNTSTTNCAGCGMARWEAA